MVVDPSRWVAGAFVAESDVGRVQAGQKARVYLGLHSSTVQSAKVLEVDTARSPGGRRNVGRKLIAAVYFSPISLPNI